jgi:deoxyadenosine/deoxycytidine kinase
MADITIVALEGLIGAGKTTVFQALKKRFAAAPWKDYEVAFLDECVDVLNECRIDGVTYHPLQAFYDDPKREATAMQIFIVEYLQRKLVDKLAELQPTEKPILIISDRSVESTLVFLETMRDSGYISDFSTHVVKSVIASIRESIPATTGVYYVNTPVTQCQERIKMRNRDGEDHLTRDDRYLRLLAENYTKWMKKNTDVTWLNSRATTVAEREDELYEFIVKNCM